jgi:hypothetical protein
VGNPSSMTVATESSSDIFFLLDLLLCAANMVLIIALLSLRRALNFFSPSKVD